MEEKWKEEVKDLLKGEYIDGIISNSTNKEAVSKIKLRTVELKGKRLIQITRYSGKQVFHENVTCEELPERMEAWFFGDVVRLKQAQLKNGTMELNILVSKKGKVTVKRKDKKETEIPFRMDLSHNRVKRHILKEGMQIPFLIDLGVMTRDGKIVRTKYDKFKQINRFLEFIEDILPSLPTDREVVILDFGCGKSYLTFAMYYYLHEMKKYNVRIIGLDLKKDVIEHCNSLSKKYGYEKLTFFVGDIASYEGVSQVDMVVTLHACDTATDYALYKGITWNAKVILSVPCCQHELNNKLQVEGWDSVFRYGIIKERTAALFTDALRANILESKGYKTQILEFIDMEHTPKNLLIRAVRQKDAQPEAWEEYVRMAEILGGDITLGKLCKEEGM